MVAKQQTAVATVPPAAESTALAVTDSSQFLALQPGSELAEALAINLSGGESISAGDLIRVKTPSAGGRTWSYTDADGVERDEKTITGLFVYYGVRGTLWGTKDPAKGTRPVLTSYDLVTATRTNDNLGDIDAEDLERFRTGDRTYDWRALSAEGSPFGWGSGKDGIGRLAKESRVLGILQAGEAWPVLISVQAGSLSTVCPWVKRLKVAHFRVVASLSLQKETSKGGIDFSQIVPTTIGTISREEGDIIRKLYTEPLAKLSTQIDDE
jgi:hypothetical protein